MKKNNIILAGFLGIALLSSCEKLPLQKDYKYEKSFKNAEVGMSVYDFMQSRKDIFSGMLAAIEYVEEDPNYKGFSDIYKQKGYTFLLLHNNALTNQEDGNAYFVKNTVKDTDPDSPTYNTLIRASDWSQYPREAVLELLKYHILKGDYQYKTLNSKPRWADTYALSSTNDTAKVHIYLQATREGYLFLNNYPENASTFKEIRPRTPNLIATNGVIHVMARYLFEPTKQVLLNNNY